ncbi:hypothetical protein BU23DRAFT_572356 [Bimuria novae-zelandiae CBS 107.79]|uniref:F-box domain-containing protein n=1 Tax=Bimuria novae-zelandiae CBS 107.79 TaxID=1447943 RepID=A0A6A5V562_9PLEO|nr:hypothetical protein BU23DRAFT_572356 [Bimuria novae-zelandiae CBS 107.79]
MLPGMAFSPATNDPDGVPDTSSSRSRDIRLPLMELPTEIRLQIFDYVFRNQSFIVTFPHNDTEERPPRHWWRWCACDSTIRSLNPEMDQTPGPYCDCTDVNHDLYVHEDTNPVSLLSVSKQVHREVQDVLRPRVFTFNHPADLDRVLLTGPPGRAKRENLTTLSVTICPRSYETHVWNLALMQLYLPHGTMSSPLPQFPALKTLHFVFKGKMCDTRDHANSTYGSKIMWIYTFRFFRLENLDDVSVDTTAWRVVKEAEEEIGVDELEEERNRFADSVHEFIMTDWEPGEEDDIEALRIAYNHRLGGVEGWVDPPPYAYGE